MSGRSTVLISGLSGVGGRLGGWTAGLYGNAFLCLALIDAERCSSSGVDLCRGEPGADEMGCGWYCDMMACWANEGEGKVAWGDMAGAGEAGCVRA